MQYSTVPHPLRDPLVSSIPEITARLFPSGSSSPLSEQIRWQEAKSSTGSTLMAANRAPLSGISSSTATATTAYLQFESTDNPLDEQLQRLCDKNKGLSNENRKLDGFFKTVSGQVSHLTESNETIQESNHAFKEWLTRFCKLLSADDLDFSDNLETVELAMREVRDILAERTDVTVAQAIGRRISPLSLPQLPQTQHQQQQPVQQQLPQAAQPPHYQAMLQNLQQRLAHRRGHYETLQQMQQVDQMAAWKPLAALPPGAFAPAGLSASGIPPHHAGLTAATTKALAATKAFAPAGLSASGIPPQLAGLTAATAKALAATAALVQVPPKAAFKAESIAQCQSVAAKATSMEALLRSTAGNLPLLHADGSGHWQGEQSAPMAQQALYNAPGIAGIMASSPLLMAKTPGIAAIMAPVAQAHPVSVRRASEDTNDDDNSSMMEAIEPEELIPDFSNVVGTDEGRPTTVIVRNIPARYDQMKLLLEWSVDGSFDLMYLPYNYQAHKTVGYAFINFCSHAQAIDFIQKWNHQRLFHHRHTKRLDIRWAELQGMQSNLVHFKRSKIGRITNEKFQPMIFHGPERLDFKSVLAATPLPVEHEPQEVGDAPRAAAAPPAILPERRSL